MKKIVLLIGIMLLSVLGSTFPEFRAKAEDTAVFHVQASEVLSDGTMKVSVYASDISNLGGIDAELILDAEKAAYVSSGLGAGFLDGYGTTHYDEEASVIKCVAVYPEAKNTQGELLHAVFQLKDSESYQPEFKIVDLLDASTEIQPIPYSICYQQADGTWDEMPDRREQKADAQIISDAKELYASDLDRERLGEDYPDDETAEELLSEGTSETRVEAETKAEDKDTEKEVKFSSGQVKDSKGSLRKKGMPYVIAGFGVLIVAAAALYIRKTRGD